MDILLEWLNNDVKLSSKITNIDEQFANGYFFGELLSKYNQILDIEKFKNKNSKNYVVDNFTQIETVLRRLGVKFTLNQAIQIKNKEKEIAVNLLRVLKNALDKTEALVDIQILKKTGKKNMTFPLKKIDFSKEKYESIQNKIFQRRLYNTIPEQQELNLMKKNQKFQQMQKTIGKIKDQQKLAFQQEQFQKQIHMRQILINQLQRRKNYAKEWNQICEEKYRENQKITLNRVKLEKMFQKRKILIQTEKNQKKQIQDKNLILSKQIEWFEQNKKDKFNQQYLNQSGKQAFVQVQDIVKNLKKNQDIFKITQSIKQRECQQQVEQFKKERDRRLRKMIVDLKRDRQNNTFKDMKDTLKSSIQNNSMKEQQLLENFNTIKQYEKIFLENLEINKQMQWETNQMIEQNQEQFENQMKNQEQNIFQENIQKNIHLYEDYKNQYEIQQYGQIYQIFENIPFQIVQNSIENFESEQIKFEKNINFKEYYQQWLYQQNNSINDFNDKKLDSYLQIFKNENLLKSKFFEIFNKEIYSKYNEQQEKLNQDNYQINVLILGQPQTEYQYLSQYLSNYLNLEYIKINEEIKNILDLQDVKILSEKEKIILDIINNGQEINISNELDFLYERIEHIKIDLQINNIQVEQNQNVQQVEEIQNQQNVEILAQKKDDDYQDDNNLTLTLQNQQPLKKQDFNTNFVNQETIKKQQLPNKQKEKENLPILENDEIIMEQNEQNQIEQNDQQKDIDQQEIQSNQDKQSCSEEQKVGILLNNLNTIEKVIQFEQKMSNLKPINFLQKNENEQNKILFNKLYSEKLIEEKQLQKLYFDLVFLLKKDPYQILNQKFENNINKFEDKNNFQYKEILNIENEMNKIKEFYKCFESDNQTQTYEYFVENQFSEILDKIQTIIQQKIKQKSQTKQQNLQKIENEKLQQKLQQERQELIKQQIENNKIYQTNEYLEILNEQLQDNKNNSSLQKKVNILQNNLQNYCQNITEVLLNKNQNQSSFEKFLQNFFNKIYQQLQLSPIFDFLTQIYIQKYNVFYNENLKIIQQEEIINEMYVRCDDFQQDFLEILQKEIQRTIEILQSIEDQQILQNQYQKQITTFIVLIEEEVQKFLIEKDLLKEIINTNEYPKLQQINDKKKQDNNDQNDYIITNCDFSLLEKSISSQINSIIDSEKSEEILIQIIEKINILIDNDQYVYQEEQKNTKKDTKKDNQQNNLDKQQDNTVQEMKENLKLKIKIILNLLNKEILQIYQHFKKFKNYSQKIIQSTKQNYENLLEELIFSFMNKIDQQQSIDYNFYLKGFQLQINSKILYQNKIPKKVEQKIQSINNKDCFSINDLIIWKQLLFQNSNKIGNIQKELLEDLFVKLQKNQSDEISLPNLWQQKNKNDYDVLIKNFTDYEDGNFVMKESLVPSQSLLDHYKDFSGSIEIKTEEQFQRIKLFFEYNEQNEIEQNESKKLKYKFIKKQIFQLFYDEESQILNFEDLIDYFGYLYEMFEQIEGKKYFEAIFLDK